ncbi:MAG: hypothetical protein ACYC7I_10660 [Gammaproteobacteria bacterium]
MLSAVYCAIRDGLTKLFSARKVKTPIAAFADDIYRAAAACAHIVVRDNDDVDEDCRLSITMVFIHAFIHAADRHAFASHPDKRKATMDELVMICSAKLIAEFSGPSITREERLKILDIAREKYNESSRIYGDCTKTIPDGDESPKGTFVWEFGKRFSAAAKHPMDIACIAFGSKLFLDTLKHLDVSKKLAEIK